MTRPDITAEVRARLAWCDNLSARAAALWPDMGRDTLKDLPWAVLAHRDQGRAVLGVGRIEDRPALLLEDGAAILYPWGERFTPERPACLLEVE